MQKETDGNISLDPKLTGLFTKARKFITFVTESRKRLDEGNGALIKRNIWELAGFINDGFSNSIDLQLKSPEGSPDTEAQFVRIQPKFGPLFLLTKTVAIEKDSIKNLRKIEDGELVENNLGLRIINAFEEMVKAQEKPKV